MLRQTTFRRSISAHQVVSRKRLVLTSRVGESTSLIKFNEGERLVRSYQGARDPSLQDFAFSVKKLLEEH